VFTNSDSQWLTFIDSDDWVHPDFLQILYMAAQNYSCKISACAFYCTAGEEIPHQEEFPVQCMTADDYYCGSEHDSTTMTACNKLYHKSLFRSLRYPVGKLHEDEFTTYLAIYAAGEIAVTPARLYAYYQNPDGIMRSKWHPGRMDVLEAFEGQIAFAREQHNSRLLNKIAEQYIYSACEQLEKADRPHCGELRKKLRRGLKLGRQCGCFPGTRQNLWAYEAAYPLKPFWWLVSKITAARK